MENLYPCSFKCVKSVAVIVCLYSPPFLFFISRTVFFSLHRIFNTFSQKDVLFTVFGFLEYMYIFLTFLLLFCDKIKSLFAENHGHFLKFVVKTPLTWLVLCRFFCVFSQSKTICNLHSCYPQNSLRASSPIWASEVNLARTRERGGFVARSRVLARLAQIGELARRLPLEELHSFLSQPELSNFFEYIIKPISALVRLRAVSLFP